MTHRKDDGRYTRVCCRREFEQGGNNTDATYSVSYNRTPGFVFFVFVFLNV